MESSVKVAVRVRPLNEREKESNSKVIISMSGNQTTIESNKYHSLESSRIPVNNKPSTKRFVYDYSYWSVAQSDQHFTSQEQVFQDLGTKVLDAAFEGYNACVFAYGQTGAGKTYTMMGTQNDPGLTPRICEGLYKHASVNSNDQESFRIEVSYLEIYNEQVLDLLRIPSHKKRDILPARLRVREHPKDGPYVQGLTKHDAPDYSAIESLLNQGNQLRKTAATKMNDHSSRSHAIFTIKYTQAKFVSGLPSEITSKINLVDLAGSERAAKSGATGDRLKEGGNINRSLTTLGSVISSLAEKSSQKDNAQRKVFIPYRDSVLTWLLKDSLGGNSKTIMIAAIAPGEGNYGETLSTLRYADRAKNIINAPTINEDPNVKLIRELKAEIERLKTIIDGDHGQVQQSVATETLDEAQKLLEGTESKMERHLRDWADKWRDTLLIMEENDLGLHKHRSTLRIDMDPPHLVLLDDDPLNTSITIFSLKEGENFIGNLHAEEELDLVFDNDAIQNEHCVVTYDTRNVILKPLNGYCSVNNKTITEPTKLSQGDVILLGEDIRLKFNYPQEACFLREQRRSGHFTRSFSLDKSTHMVSTPRRLEEVTFIDQPLSPESGVEMDPQEEESTEEKNVDKLKQQVEDLLAQYKQSEIERFEIETKNKRELEAKDKEIETQAKELIKRQKNDEALLQKHQKELQNLREQLSDEKTRLRNELMQQMERLFSKMQNTNHALIEDSKKELEKQRKRLNRQLKREWSKLDQYEMKLIEVEAEKRRIIQDAENRLKQERNKSEIERKHRLQEVETQKKSLQEILEGHLKEREVARKDFQQSRSEEIKLSDIVEESLDIFCKKLTKLEWLQYKLSADQLETDEKTEIMLKIETVNKDIEILERQNEENAEKLRQSEMELKEKGEILKRCEANVERSLAEMTEVREKLVGCQQRFGEELGDVVNIVSLERDADLMKIEKDREILMSKYLEHQSALEVLVNENLESSDDEDSLEVREIKSRVVELVRSVSPGLDDESMQSQIIEKKVQIHYQQAQVGKNEEERKTLLAHEQIFLQQSREVQNKRENEQKVLQEKLHALIEMTDNEEGSASETVDYYQAESSSLVTAQRRIFDVEKELAEKIKERKDIEAKLDHVKRQMEQQAECNQEEFHGILARLELHSKDVGKEIEEMKKILKYEAEKYLRRLKTENFTVLEPLSYDNSSFAEIANEAVDEILREIELASHCPELAKTHKDIKQDCGGWRYDGHEKDVHLLRKEDDCEAIHSFLGRGIIRASPRTVLQTVSTPPSRFVYDRMLKNIRIVEKIADNLTIVHMVHETTRCLFKTSRDFCFVSMDREKDGKLILACQSVEHQSCPEVRGIQRAKILSSGWVIEPITVKGQACSLVWYLTQVFLGRSIPSKLVQLVSKRQPLSVAYLREYLVAE
ncbi:kinesin-like protein KIF16B isoform X2 [Dendronephthya gigantea]|uniref:kinesin-like protein KIF16B isoform X2 n=1 Tax=Dendronephthya gigantea TaxID=151771 RepID=UPI00106A658D|nr:kinesin-like protein KIF16B isoform X2 [Dendronephthya gigantea]